MVFKFYEFYEDYRVKVFKSVSNFKYRIKERNDIKVIIILGCFINSIEYILIEVMDILVWRNIGEVVVIVVVGINVN